MFQRNQTVSILFVVIFVGILSLCKESYAEPPEIKKIVVTPIITAEEEILVGSDPRALKVVAKGEDPLEYEWKLDGPGRFQGPIDGSAVRYIPPEQIDGKTSKATITVTVTDAMEQEATESIAFTLKKRSPGTNWWVFGAGAAAALGGGVALAVSGGDSGDGNDSPSIQITSPVEGAQVDWITNVYGTAKGFENGDYVAVSIQPYYKEWYLQSSTGMVASDGNWVVPGCYFGLEGPGDIGYHFRFRVELWGRSGQEKAFDTIEKVTRR